MESTERLNLNLSRTFSEKLGDTFKFIRLNAGVLLQTHLFISLPLIILSAGLLFLLFRDYFSLISTVDSGIFIDEVRFRRENYSWAIQNLLFPALAVLPVSANTLLVMNLYEKKKGEKVTFQEVWKQVPKQFTRVMLAKLVMLPIILFAQFPVLFPDDDGAKIFLALFFGIVGMIFYTLFSCVEMLILQHDYPIFKAMGRSSKIMNRFFWPTLGLHVVILIVYLFMTFAMEFPAMIIDTLEGISVLDMDMDGFWPIFSSALRAFSGIAGFLLFTIPAATVGINYFSIKEQTNRSNIMERIQSIGVVQQPEDIYAEDEQY